MALYQGGRNVLDTGMKMAVPVAGRSVAFGRVGCGGGFTGRRRAEL